MAIEKYGVEDRKELLEQELKEVKRKLGEKIASSDEKEFLVQREKDLEEAIASL
jgi:hypothetical protein